MPWTEQRERRALAEELPAFAAAMGGSNADLDEALEASGVDALRERLA